MSNPFKPRSRPLTDRLAEHKRQLEADAATVNPGSARDDIVKRLRQLEVAAHLDEWLSSPGLQSPR